ncbi:hypothetical protein CPB85DRAFT_1439932 [Mucidula mucida]|nr:hypothetical protein CPB85DRAFT_1439932 [Mucidula mucida]
MQVYNNPMLFGAESALTKGASPLNTVLLSLEDHFPQLAASNPSPKALGQVTRNLHSILAMIKFYRGTLAPIHHLPDDILVRIFRIHLHLSPGAD